MTRALALISVVGLAAAGTGCMAGHVAHGATMSAPPEETAAPGGTMGMSMAACPMAVPGTQLAAMDTQEGEALTFTTSPDRADELRARVRAMADVHNRHHAGGMQGMQGSMQHGGMMGGGTGQAGPGAMAMMPPPSRATVRDVEGGAQLVVTPNDPADLERLRSTIRMHADRMRQTGSCAEHAGM